MMNYPNGHLKKEKRKVIVMEKTENEIQKEKKKI